MKTWDEVTKEELILEYAPGVYATNAELQNQLNWYEYLRHMRDMLRTGILSDSAATREHIQDVLVDIFMNMVHVMEDRSPEPGEIDHYIRGEYAQKTINTLTGIALELTEENWPEFKERMCKEVGIDPNEI